jgi:hypothetical protein
VDFVDATPTPGCGFSIPQEFDPATYKNRWAPLCASPLTVPGRYWLQVQSTGPGDGANRYALRATSAGAPKATLSAFRDMSMFNNQLDVNPNFYLAKVDPIHKGKTFLVSLYDPGEINVAGAQMEVLDPSGAVAPSCKVSKFTNPTDSTAYEVVTLSPCSIPTTNATGGALYNGRLLTIDIKIPTTYSCAFCWWRIRYNLGPTPSGSPADTTTWSAAIKGDPVHLVNE